MTVELRELRSGKEEGSWETHLRIDVVLEALERHGPFVHISEGFIGFGGDNALHEAIRYRVGEQRSLIQDVESQ